MVSSTVDVDNPSIANGKKRSVSAKSSKSKERRGSRLAQIFSLSDLSINQVAILSIFYLLLLHLGALTLFTQGFLLKRTTLETCNECDLANDADCTLPAKFDRAVIVLIDALRWDFLFPRSADALDFDSTHHNHLTVPIRLTQSQPEHSLLYKAVADPPTTTLQRLKAITTGSLPTFIDAGSNFAGSRVDEDNWLEQANRAGKEIAFMGDDTWLTIFPESIFAPNSSFPFDSFHVEDLDTVDAGVRHHVLPLLDRPRDKSGWDILIAHPLGLDHAGHRFGASHSETTRKLKEMNQLLSDIVERLAEKDLLVVMGDHGMDAKGDHGGDSPEETDSGLWLYSKQALVPKQWKQHAPFAKTGLNLGELLERSAQGPAATAAFFAADNRSERQVQQISLVPTLSLLLGLALPYNNLGSIIPELFLPKDERQSRWLKQVAASTLSDAIRINSHQMQTYLKGYASHSGGSDLAPFVPDLLELYKQARAEGKDAEEMFLADVEFMQAALQTTRGIWARFDPISMGAGILLLLASLAACCRMYKLSKLQGPLWREGALRVALSRGLIGLAIGITSGLIACASCILFDLNLLSYPKLTILLAGLFSAIAVCFTKGSSNAQPFASKAESRLAVAILASHVLIFASNSYILWEDSTVLVLQQLPPLLLAIKALHAPERRLRWRTAGFALLSMLASRMIAFSSVCREEQHPYCTATFYGSSGTSIASPSAIFAAIAAALALPSVAGMFLDITRSRQAWAPSAFSYTLRGTLVGGAIFWGADYLEQMGTHGATSAYASSKVLTARLLQASSVLLATFGWGVSPLCIDIQQETSRDQDGQVRTQVKVLGFANAIGSSYLLLFLAIYGLIFLLAQPIGQIVMAVGLIGLLSFLQANDSARDSLIVKRAFEDSGAKDESTLLPAPTLLSIAFVALTGFVQYFATGHQAVLSSIQWKTAFVGFPKLTYPFSPILVVLNTIGPFILSAAAIPLLVFWNVPPTLKAGPTIPLLSNLLTACFGFLAYHTALTLSSAIFAAHLRRHLMVWKVFAPRFMLSALTLLSVDVTILVIAVGWGGIGTLKKLNRSLGTAWS